MFWVNGLHGVFCLSAGWHSSYQTRPLVCTHVDIWGGNDIKKPLDATTSFRDSDSKIYKATEATKCELIAYIIRCQQQYWRCLKCLPNHLIILSSNLGQIDEAASWQMGQTLSKWVLSSSLNPSWNICEGIITANSITNSLWLRFHTSKGAVSWGELSQSLQR